MIATCEFCNKDYKTFKNWYNRAKHHTCSKECSAELKKKLSVKTCKNCSKEYYKTSHQKTSKFCSQKCKSESDKKRTKIKCNTCNKEYEVVKSRKENSKFCSTECLRKYTGHLASLRVGELNSAYKGFNDQKRTNKSKLKSWSRLVLRRDKVCQSCGRNECLQAHHIIPYRDNEELRFDITNGILLCKYCHAKEHENDKVSVKHLILNNNVKKELDR